MSDTAAVTLAEERLAEAHSAAARAQRDYARAIAEARRDLGRALRQQEGPDADAWGTPPNISDDDIAQIRAEALAIGIPENAAGTSLQEVELLRRLPPSLAALLIEHWRSFANVADRCRWGNHEHQIEQLQTLLNEARAVHDCWNHSHPKEPAGD